MAEGSYWAGDRWVSAEEMTKLRRTLRGKPRQPPPPRPPKPTTTPTENVHVEENQ